MTTCYARQYAAAVRRYAAPRGGIESFAAARKAAIDAMWADAAHYAGSEDRDRHLGAVATTHRVFADYLADHDDPREDLVRQDADAWERNASSVASAERVLGSPHQFLPERPLTVHLNDGTSFSVVRLAGMDGRATAGRVTWHVPHAAGVAAYEGYYPVATAARLVARLAPEHAGAVAHHLRTGRRADHTLGPGG